MGSPINGMMVNSHHCCSDPYMIPLSPSAVSLDGLLSVFFSSLYYSAILYQPKDLSLRKILMTLWCPGSVSQLSRCLVSCCKLREPYGMSAFPHLLISTPWSLCHMAFHFPLLENRNAEELDGLTTTQEEF